VKDNPYICNVIKSKRIMYNRDKIIDKMLEVGRKSVSFKTPISMEVEIRIDTIGYIDFNIITLKVVKLMIKKNCFDKNLLYAETESGIKYNCTWVSEKDTDIILSLLNNKSK